MMITGVMDEPDLAGSGVDTGAGMGGTGGVGVVNGCGGVVGSMDLVLHHLIELSSPTC